MPKVIPDKITSQYEQEEHLLFMKESLKRGEITFKKPEGIDRRYQSVKALPKVSYLRNPTKEEAMISPEP